LPEAVCNVARSASALSRMWLLVKARCSFCLARATPSEARGFVAFS
jgi:hypothetical protein